MNIQTFNSNYDNLKPEARADYLSRVIRELVFKDDENARFVIENLLVDLEDLEADDYFGTEGYREYYY